MGLKSSTLYQADQDEITKVPGNCRIRGGPLPFPGKNRLPPGNLPDLGLRIVIDFPLKEQTL